MSIQIWKDRAELVQSVVSIFAIFVGGWWAYDNFIKERKHLPHGNIEHIISHYPLSNDINLLGIVLKITNTGHSRMDIVNTVVRIQQVVPIAPCGNELPCEKNQINIAINEATRKERKEDRFSWMKIAERINSLESPLVVEPGETEYMDFEFAIPAGIRVVRIYSYVRNETNKDLGWHRSSFYQLSHELSEQTPP